MSFYDLRSAEKQEIEENLERFGLNATDQRAYLALLPLGATTLAPLAQASGLRLTTVQSAVARLTRRGLVKVTKRGSRHVYEALDPVALRRILERQAEEAAAVVPLLQKLRGEPLAPSKIRVFYRERMTDIFHLALKARSRLVYEIVSARDFQDILGERFHFSARRVKSAVRLKSLRVESREIKKYSAAVHASELRDARFLPRELTFRSSVMFWDDTVAFFTTNDEGLAWTVKSASLRDMMGQLFDMLWSVSRRMETM